MNQRKMWGKFICTTMLTLNVIKQQTLLTEICRYQREKWHTWTQWGRDKSTTSTPSTYA